MGRILQRRCDDRDEVPVFTKKKGDRQTISRVAAEPHFRFRRSLGSYIHSQGIGFGNRFRCGNVTKTLCTHRRFDP